MKSYKVETMQPEWIAEVARIHMDALPNDFLPGLGFDFLNKVFYPATLNSEYAKVYTAIEDNHPLGFVIVTQNGSRLFRSIVMENIWKFVKIGFRTSFSSISQFKKNFEILTSSLKKGVLEDYGEIYEIAVRPDCQGQGIGKKLVQASMDYLKQDDMPGIKIKTRKDNTAWVQYFLHQGWHLTQEIKLINNEYVILSLGF